MVSTVGVVVGMLLVSVGGYGLYVGHERRGPYELVTETPTTTARQLSAPGRVELKGTVEVADEGAGTFSSPIGRRECVLAAWSVEEYSERGKHSRWQTVASGVRSVPFFVADETGRVLVDVGDHADGGGLLGVSENAAASDGVTAGPVLAEFDRFPVAATVGAEEPAPDHVARFVAGERSVDQQTGSITNVVDIGTAHGDRRYYERTLAPGDDVYVLGDAVPRDPDADVFRAEDLVVRPGEERFVVSNERERDIVRGLRWYKLGIAGGIVAVGLGLLVLGFGLGVA